jgi:hypothetical protein
MKTKKISKKLILNKQTITHLRNGEMTKVAGGATILCPTYGGDTLCYICSTNYPTICNSLCPTDCVSLCLTECVSPGC